MLKLNLGAGVNIKPTEEGWVNIDSRDLPGIDIVMDIEKEPLPFSAGTVDEINMQDFLEHLPGHFQVDFLSDIYLLLKQGGKVYIQIPHLRVLAERYLDIMDNPTNLQHPLTAEQFAQVLYGGQEYAENFHKWAYDGESLRIRLESVGFAVRSIGSDGGQNLLCNACRFPNKLFIVVGGGMGDCIQTYLADPAHDSWEKAYMDGRFPSSDLRASLWLRRLEAVKMVYPDLLLTLIIQSHNPKTKEIFELHPYIDGIVEVKWGLDCAEEQWDGIHYGAYQIHDWLQWKYFEPSDPKIYLSEKEEALVNAIKSKGEYIVVHPYAGSIRREPITMSDYDMIIQELAKSKQVVVVGASYRTFTDDTVYISTGSYEFSGENVIDLVNKVTARVSTALVLGCSGFVGTHSAMLLPAWSKHIPSVCIVPPEHDGGQPWEEFFASDNKTTWGADKPFNKTIIVRDRNSFNTQEVIDWIHD